jgi:hypothetical protein
MKNWLEQYFGWLNLKDEKEVEWGINYLTERGVYPSSWVNDRDASFFRYLTPDIAADEKGYAPILEKMKRAHSSRDRRKDPKKKPVQFHLSKTANSALANLAKDEDMTKIAMLESLILKMDELKRKCAEELRDDKEELARRFSKKVAAVERRTEESYLGRKNEELKVELATWRAKALRSENEMKAALQRLCELEVSAGMSAHDRVSLTYEQEEEVKKRYLTRLKPGLGIGQA